MADEYQTECSERPIDLLIGSDYYYEMITGDIIRGDIGPVAVSSIFGYMLCGTMSENQSDELRISSNLVIQGHCETLAVKNTKSDELVDNLKRFWEIDSMGTNDDENENKEHEILKDIDFVNKRYQVRLPWVENELMPPLPEDYNLCKGRLNSPLFRLRKDPDLLKQYDAVFQEQLSTGIIEIVPESEYQDKNVHFIAHQPVIRKDRDTTKTRVVFDASAKDCEQQFCLNDYLEERPNNTIPHIFAILIKFRSKSIALTADIQSAFLQIGISPEDRDKLRFLWYTDLNSDSPKLVQFRFARLMFGLKPSPPILGKVIEHHLSKYEESEPAVVNELKNLYVDDFASSFENDDVAFETYKTAKEIMQEGNFNLRKWNTNSDTLLQSINQVEGISEEITAQKEAEKGGTVEVLGKYWDTRSDEIFFDFSELSKTARSMALTKRNVLRFGAKIYDPLGLLSPFTIRLKLLFQELCHDRIEWDSNLSHEHEKKYLKLISEVGSLNEIRVARVLSALHSKPKTSEIHGFADASESAYAAVVYLRTTYEAGKPEVKLIASKSKVAPLIKKSISIPKLELQGTLLLARLVDSIKAALPFPRTQCLWTDSMTALCWITNFRLWKVFVKNRTDQIRKLSCPDDWRHCPGEINPADLPTRGLTG